MRINIIGSAPGWEECPVNDGQIWGVNNMHLLRDVDLIIDVHKSRTDVKEIKDVWHLKILKEKNIHAFFYDKIPDMPNVERYPIEEIKKEFGTDYFACGIDYMVALALYRGATEIHIYGVWMECGTEYAFQKASMEFWLGYAMGRGVKVEVHGKHGSLLRTHNGLLYGYQEPQEWVRKHHSYYISLEDLKKQYEDADQDSNKQGDE